MKPKQILILTSDMGFGHRSTANAMTAAFESRYGEAVHVEVINAFDHKSIPSVVRDQQTEYDRRVRESPQLYQASYQAMDWSVSTSLLEIGLTALLFQALSDILKQITPDLIIVTHPMYLEPLNTIFHVTGRTIPIITIVTDLGTVQKIWFNDVSNITFVPTERVYDLALQAKLPASTVKITGIPVHPQINDEKRTPAEIRSSLALDPARMTALVVGSSRVNNLLDAVQVLNYSNQPIQLIVVAGGDDAVYAALQKMEWHLPVAIYNFVNNMPTLMHAADFIVCKAGGLVVTEALACGLPILLIDVIEGQETGNAEFVVNNDAGEVARKPLEMLEALFHWVSGSGKRLQTLAENARKVGRPHAADEICEQALALMTAKD
ncbi:MAG: glycosyltransferase [Anaerolineae bacterium]|nr:glycosyltransferase [Anaerolineae bacterium]